jgi:RNA polymerase sigma factor (sigma-70 family)
VSGPAGPHLSVGSEPVTDDDAELIAQSLDCPERFAMIYDKHVAGIHRYVAGRLGPDVADDLVAETFLVAFRGRAGFDPARGAARPWLYGIATNLVARHRRAEARRYRAVARAGPDPDEPGQEDDIAERLTAQQLRRPLARAVARLPTGERDAFLLIALAGLSYEEVARALSIPVGTVGSRLTRARQRIRNALGGLEPEPPMTKEKNSNG